MLVNKRKLLIELGDFGMKAPESDEDTTQC